MVEPHRHDLIFTTVDQTGDQYHIAGALALDDNTHACLIYNSNVEPGLTAKFFEFASPERFIPKRLPPRTGSEENPAKTIYNFLANREPYPKEPLVHLLDKARPKSATIKEYLGNGDPHEAEKFFVFRGKENATHDQNDYFQVWGPQQATQAIANVFDACKIPDDYVKVYTRAAKRLSLLPLTLDVKKSMFGGLEMPPLPEKGPVVLLWARYTGQREGYGIRGDSDPVGQKQLLAILVSLGWPVITIGHGPLNGEDVESEYPLREFYLKPPMKGEHRGAQISFFLALMEMYPGCLIQIGQKTGGMDAGALLGIPTLYIEDEDNPATKRMQKWVDKVPNYHRVEVQAPPTVTGKALKKAFDKREKGSVNEQMFKIIDESSRLSFRQLNVITLLYQLQKFSEKITDGVLKEKTDGTEYTLEFLKKYILKLDVDDVVLQKWEANVSALKDSELATTSIVRGYSPKDIGNIWSALVNAWTKYSGSSEVVRVNPAGQPDTGRYVQRSDISKVLVEKSKL